MALTRNQLAQLPYAYFAAVDAKDLDAALAFFADDATFTIQSAHTVYTGKSEIAGMFRGFFADFATIVHNPTNVVVDETSQKVSSEQICPHVANDGALVRLTTCNFYDVGADGRFRRVVIWIDGVNPLVGE
jgi:uncharacterized protein (TIGR02246 family)